MIRNFGAPTGNMLKDNSCGANAEKERSATMSNGTDNRRLSFARRLGRGPEMLIRMLSLNTREEFGWD